MKPKERQAMNIQSALEAGYWLETYKNLKILRQTGQTVRGQSGCARLQVYWGNEGNPSTRYYYRTETQMENSIREKMTSADNHAAYKAEQSAARKAVSNASVEVGSIYHSSWGYDQTNNDYYQVVGKFGSKGLILQEITMTQTEATGPMSANVTPSKNCFKGEPFRKIMTGEGINIDSVRWASKWNEKPNYDSWYH